MRKFEYPLFMSAQSNLQQYPPVSILMVFHNGMEQTLCCLESVKELDYPNYGVTVVDDGSTDGSSEAIAERFPYVQILKGDGSLWCNGSFNLAIKKCIEEGSKLFLLLNSDNVIAPDALSYLVETYQSSNIPIVGSLVGYLHKPDTVSYAGKLIDWKKGNNILIHNGMRIKDVKYEVIDIDFLGFQGVLISKEVFEKIGLVDDKTFKHYSGDTDFYLRAKKAGFKVVVDTRSVVWDDIDVKGGTGVKPTLWEFIKELHNIKSLSHLPTRYRFYKRHAPQFWAIPFGKYYFQLLKGQVISMIKYRLNQVEGSNGLIQQSLRKLIGRP